MYCIYTYVRKVFHHLEQNGLAAASILIRPMNKDSLEPYLIILNALFWREKYLMPSFDKCRKYRVWILALKYENCIKVNNAKNTRTFQRRKVSHEVSKGKWTIFSQNWRAAELSSFYNQYLSSGSIAKKARSGRPSKINERGERTVCRTAKTLRFGTLKAIVEEVRQSDVCKTATKYIVRKILHKYKILSHKRRRKPFVSPKNRRIRLQWVREHHE